MKEQSLSHHHEKLISEDNFLILMHSKPDGDAIGAAYSMLLYLQDKGKKAKIGIEEPLLEKYIPFVDDADYRDFFIEYSQIKEWGLFENVLIVDCSTLSLLGFFKDFAVSRKGNCFVIDHHETSDGIDAESYIQPQASSTSEIMFDLFKEQNYPLSKKISLVLYLGFVYDTGQFCYLKGNYEVLNKAAFLIKQNPDINPEEVHTLLFANESLERKKVICSIINSIDLLKDSKIALAYLTKSMLKKLKNEGVNYTDEDLIDLVQVPHSLKNVLVSVMIREKEGLFSFSFRSRCSFNVDKIANKFGGGGHKKAAGLKITNMTLEEIQNTVIKHLVEEFEKDYLNV